MHRLCIHPLIPMEAERLNQINALLTDLARRAEELRGYL